MEGIWVILFFGKSRKKLEKTSKIQTMVKRFSLTTMTITIFLINDLKWKKMRKALTKQQIDQKTKNKKNNKNVQGKRICDNIVNN